jgi:O-antigen/teichoic acid export membrane protein
MAAMPQSFLHNLQWQYVASLCAVIMGFAWSLVVGRALGARTFGLISAAIGFSSIVFQFAELRLQEAVIRFIAEFWEARDEHRTIAAVKLFLVLDAVTGVIAFLLVCGGARWAQRNLMSDPRAIKVLLLAALMTLFTNVGTATALGLYRIFGRFKRQAIITTISAAVRLTLTVAAIFVGGWGAVGVMAVAVAVSLCSNLVLILTALAELRARVAPDALGAPMTLLRERRSDIVKFVGSTYCSSLSMIPTKDLDINVLAMFTSLEVVGIYRIGKNFMAALWMLSDPAFLVVYPELARMWVRKEFAEIRRFVGMLTVVLGASALVAYALAFVIVPPVIVLLLGSQYAPAGEVFRWMTWGLVVWAPFVWLSPLILAAGRPELSLKSGMITAVFAALAQFAVVPRFGANGAAFVYALTNPVAVILLWTLGRHAGILFPAPVAAACDEAVV